jgi:hypothetical protein
MESLPLIAGAVVLTLIVLLLLLSLSVRSRRRRRSARVRLRPVLGARELACYRVLQRALPTHLIMPAISYAGFLQFPESADKIVEQSAQELRAHMADFLVCDHRTRPVAVIVLGHRITDEAEALLRDAAIPLLRYQPERLPTEQEIRDTFHDLESLGGLSRHLGEDGPDTPAPDLPGRAGKGRREPRL